MKLRPPHFKVFLKSCMVWYTAAEVQFRTLRFHTAGKASALYILARNTIISQLVPINETLTLCPGNSATPWLKQACLESWREDDGWSLCDQMQESFNWEDNSLLHVCWDITLKWENMQKRSSPSVKFSHYPVQLCMRPTRRWFVSLCNCHLEVWTDCFLHSTVVPKCLVTCLNPYVSAMLTWINFFFFFKPSLRWSVCFCAR